MLEHQNEHFVGDFLKISHFVASKSTFSYEFSLEPENWLPENRCFVRGLRQFSAHLTKCHAHHAICTLSPLDAALTMRFAQNTQHDTSKVLRLPCEMTMEVAKVPRLPRTMFLKLTQKYCACHTKRLPTRYETCWTVTKCYACHAKRGYAALETSKSDRFSRTRHRHGHTGPPQTVADGCERSRTVAVVNATFGEHTLHPQTPRVKREPLTLATHSGKTWKNHCVVSCFFPRGIWFEEFYSFTHFHTHASHRTWYRATAPEFSAATFVWAETITEQDRAHDLAPWRGLHAFDVWIPCLIYFRTF